MTTHLHRHLAPISAGAWEEIESEARTRLATQLAGRKLVDFSGPFGWEHAATPLGRSAQIDAPVEGVAARRRQVLPLVELRAAFAISRSELDNADRGATNFDLSDLDAAIGRISLAENKAVFDGFPAADMPGIIQSSSHPPLPMPADMEHYPTAVATATDVLRQAGIGGPYGLAISPEIYTRIVETTEHGGYLLLDHLRKILDGPVVWAPGVPAGVVISLRGGDFTLECGQDLSIGYSSHDAEEVSLYLEESFTFRVAEPDAAVVLNH